MEILFANRSFSVNLRLFPSQKVKGGEETTLAQHLGGPGFNTYHCKTTSYLKLGALTFWWDSSERIYNDGLLGRKLLVGK